MVKVPPSPFLRGNVDDYGAPPRPTGDRVTVRVTRSLLSYRKTLDKQGGEVPTVQADALRLADFITLPEKVTGTNCSSCSFEDSGVCNHPKLTGQKVNEKNCCAYWTAPGTLRDWKALHKFSSTQFDLDQAGYSRTQGPPAPKVLELAAAIADDDLAEDGREDAPHVTVKYGLHTSSPEEAKAVVRDWLQTRRGLPGGMSVHAKLGKTSLFPSKPGMPFDVVKLEVDSDDLRSLHQFLSGRLEHTDTHPVYNPHVTLAYVQPGSGKKYVGTGLAGHGVILHQLVFSDQEGKKTVIDLHQLGRLGTKALSSFGESSGGALLSPPSLRRKRKGGFSGRQTDSIGRTICFQQGRRVPCGGQSSSKVKPKGRPATTEAEAARQQRTAEVKGAVEAAVLHAAGKAGHAVLTTRQAAQDVARRVGTATWDNLPEMARTVLAQTWRGAKALEHVAMTAFRKGREVSLEVAKEKGLPADRAERLAKMLATTDMVLAWTVNMPAAYALTGSMGVAKVSSWLPAASLCYLAYASVTTNPFRTLKAAKRALARGGHKALDPYDRKEIASRLADLLKTAGDPDWVLALYCAALDDTKDAADAVSRVEGVLRQDGIKSLSDFMTKGGFTGEKRDRIGRRNCYTEGKRTACAKPAKPVKPSKTGKPLGVVKKASKQGLPAAKVAAAIVQLRDAGEATPEKILELMAHLTVDGLKEVQTALGLKAGGLKAERARKIAERALYLAKEKKQSSQEPSDAGPEAEPVGGTGQDEATVEGTGGGVEETAGGPGDQGGDQGGQDDGQPLGQEAPRRLPVTVAEANKRIDRYEKLFRSSGEHQLADWLGLLRDHVNTVGTDDALKSLGEEVRGEGEQVQYGGVSEDIPAFARAYLDRHGITPITMGTLPEAAGAKLVTSVAPSVEGIATRGEGGTIKPGDVHAALPTLKDKLEESQNLPGLEKSEDINTLMGKKVTGFTPEVLSKLNEVYGEGQWIVKSYGEEAYAGYGIFFPQRVAQINQDSKNTLWSSGENLARYGFEHLREDGKVVGVKDKDGKEYKFSLEQDEAGRPRWTVDKSLYGDVRHWALEAAQAAPHEKETSFPEGSFMAQPAFPVVGISDAERAAGVTFKKGQEGRVHIATKEGKATIVPHSTWLKLEHLPVVFENDDTLAMAQAAVDAINALPESERKGQLYAPDVVKTATGYKVVEANPANEAGASGYLSDNPFVIDSYVSHITGREPAHVKFIRKLLSRRAQ